LATGSTVYLRPPAIEDRDKFIDLNRASARFYRALASPISTSQQFDNYLSRCQQEDYEGLLVCRRNDDVIVGSINLSQIFRGGFQSAYLGYQIGAPSQDVAI
jgi:ribosomal-protein-alanine N-acetyltransferase